jgi:lauroyl/myristoyl acyltransferase
MSTLFELLGWILAHCPRPIVALGCEILGGLTFYFSPRRRVILSNLAHAFPEMPDSERLITARKNCSRMFEMFLLPLAQAHFSKSRMQRDYHLPEETRAQFQRLFARGQGVIFGIPHTTMTESSTAVRAVYPELPLTVALYRPLDFAPLDKTIKKAREANGARLLSRREGLLAARQNLSSGSNVAILFDQNAREHGYLTLHFGRCASVTNLPGLLAHKTSAPCVLFYPRRTGFWKTSYLLREIQPGCPAAMTIRLNEALEQVLIEDKEHRIDYFWAHKRWKISENHDQRLLLNERKSYLPEQVANLPGKVLPRNRILAFWLPADARKARAFALFLPAIRAARPDCQTLCILPEKARAAQHFFSETDATLLLPEETRSRKKFLKNLQNKFLESLFLLDADPSTLRQARLLKAAYTSAILPDGRPKPSWLRFSFPIQLPPGDDPETWQEIWLKYLQRHGLKTSETQAERL